MRTVRQCAVCSALLLTVLRIYSAGLSALLRTMRGEVQLSVGCSGGYGRVSLPVAGRTPAGKEVSGGLPGGMEF